MHVKKIDDIESEVVEPWFELCPSQTVFQIILSS